MGARLCNFAHPDDYEERMDAVSECIRCQKNECSVKVYLINRGLVPGVV